MICVAVCSRIRATIHQACFPVYMRDLINVVVKSRCGCYIARVCLNLLACADDVVLLSPSRRGLQNLLNIIEKAAAAVEMSFNTNKTVCMVANPYKRSRWVSQRFSQFTLANCKFSCVSQFKYLCHIIEHTCDDSDINKELKSLLARVNVFIRRFSYCSI